MFKQSSNKFDLSNMVAGKQFLGCNKCGYQLPQDSAGKNTCDNCQGPMNVHIPTQEEITNSLKDIALDILDKYKESQLDWINEFMFGKPAIIAENGLDEAVLKYKDKINNY